jgi:hypothetical protein
MAQRFAGYLAIWRATSWDEGAEKPDFLVAPIVDGAKRGVRANGGQNANRAVAP